MSASLVVDASVAAKWYLAEADSDRAAVLLTGDGEFYAPTLLQVEVAAAITRRHRAGGLDDGDARLKLMHARRFIVAPAFHLIDNADLLERASEISLQLRHPVQDCLYIACAERVRGDLVTGDATLLKRAGPYFSFVLPF
jgi:predicted nucleic acid-binding protein